MKVECESKEEEFFQYRYARSLARSLDQMFSEQKGLNYGLEEEIVIEE